MSGLRKKMRRAALLRAARAQRAATAGGGQLRRPLASWVATTEQDLYDLFMNQTHLEANRVADTDRAVAVDGDGPAA